MVQKNSMSEYQHNLLGVGMAPAEVEKLVPNLRNKDRFVLHYRNLQLYMSLGMRLTKVHRALRFDQSPWMEPSIGMNTELRKDATSDFEKDLYKHRSAWWFRKSGCQSISTTSSALGWRRQRLKSWFPAFATRTALCFTIGICSCTCL